VTGPGNTTPGDIAVWLDTLGQVLGDSLFSFPLPNSALLNNSVTINTVPCTLGSTCTIPTASNPMTTLGDVIYGGASGTPTRLAGPTGPNGVPQLLADIPSGGVAVAEVFVKPGINGRAVTGTTATDTIASADCSPKRVEYVGTVDVAVTLPTATTLGVPACNFKLVNGTASSTVTVTPTTWTVNGGATLALTAGQSAVFFVDPNSATNWVADCTPLSCGTLLSPLPAIPPNRPFVTIYEPPSSNPAAYGVVNNAVPLSSGTQSTVGATATDNTGKTFTSAATASTNTLIGEQLGQADANIGSWGFGGFYRWGQRWKMGNTTNARYWLGITTFDTGGLAGEGTAACCGNTSLATNTPNRHWMGYRYANGTDTNWQCGGGNGTTQTVVDTGIAPDTTAPHTREFAYDGTTMLCVYDGVLVATVTGNLPVLPQGRTVMFWTGDNENNATAVSGTNYWMTLNLH
jgi:hypothetical protein